jgi:hypothetical protein
MLSVSTGPDEFGKPADDHHVTSVQAMVASHITTCADAPVSLCTAAAKLTNRQFDLHIRTCVVCFGGTLTDMYSRLDYVSEEVNRHENEAAASN